MLTEAGIGTSVHFIPLHEHSYYRDVLGVPRRGRCPCATAEWQRIISLPLFPGMTAADVDRVADTLRRHRPRATAAETTDAEASRRPRASPPLGLIILLPVLAGGGAC